jgi:hypothetical protein
MKLRTVNLVAIGVGVILFSSHYVKATMNALHSDYIPGISEFKEPFYYVYLLVMVGLITLFVISVFYRFKFKKGYILANRIALSALVVCAIVLALGQLPCMYQHVDPHALASTVKQSLFCPSYSNRSYIGLIITLVLAGSTFISSLGRTNSIP